MALLEAWWVARSPLLLTINAGNKILYFENKADRRKDDDTMYNASLYLLIFIIPPYIHYTIIKSSKWGFILNLCLLCATKATRASFCAVKASLCCWDSAVYYASWFFYICSCVLGYCIDVVILCRGTKIVSQFVCLRWPRPSTGFFMWKTLASRKSLRIKYTEQAESKK